ncbi:LLM class flavin-dependent oxidoreductase [Gulosibacter chungangensis]|uniref:LLM class flavin-dependent oxidoreductase n=1 Tax=Gulosibacter chungangensis TaxID=979746 RepID=A0A7J5BFP8_9MICO|nr:LLM class flavin-dependent oxidoreductase [Gulosibacter chungangensis]KAB1645103.1 LLM class flavin-dependent oxidoreductase [Gulosibacter chungangensis]
MELGIILGNIPTNISEKDHFDSILRQAEAVQKAGMTHILVGQHFHFEGSRWFQPVPLLARLAGELDPSVRLCTQILIGPLYNPVMLAEELATLDVVTGGRISVGLGLGYIPKEYETFGIPFKERGRRLNEIIEILKLMWTQDRVTYDGKYYQLDDLAVHIKPVQKPHPPIWVGAGSDAGIRRAARLGDAWPITPQETPEELPELLGKYFDFREEAGRPREGRVPLRREIMIGRDREDALAKAVDVASEWYLNMAATGHNEYVDPEGLRKSIPGVMAKHWVLGSAEEVAGQLRDIGSVVPVDPIITRANWPGMSTQDSVDYIELLGKELVPSLKEFEGVTSM